MNKFCDIDYPVRDLPRYFYSDCIVVQLALNC